LFYFSVSQAGYGNFLLMILIKALSLLQDFCAKTMEAGYNAVQWFLRANSPVHWMGTHAQQPLKEIVAEGRDFLAIIRVFLIGCHSDRQFIINMDQMPIFIDEHKENAQGAW
jgi:hypothetical protein